MRTASGIFLAATVIAVVSANCGPPDITVDELLRNPPSGWSFDCTSERLIDEFLQSEARVNDVLDCLNDVGACSSPGYTVIADQIWDAFSGGAQCQGCSPERRKLFDSTVRKLRAKYSRQYREGLSILG